MRKLVFPLCLKAQLSLKNICALHTMHSKLSAPTALRHWNMSGVGAITNHLESDHECGDEQTMAGKINLTRRARLVVLLGTHNAMSHFQSPRRRSNRWGAAYTNRDAPRVKLPKWT